MIICIMMLLKTKKLTYSAITCPQGRSTAWCSGSITSLVTGHTKIEWNWKSLPGSTSIGYSLDFPISGKLSSPHALATFAYLINFGNAKK